MRVACLRGRKIYLKEGYQERHRSACTGSSLEDARELSGTIYFVPHCRAAALASVFVFIPLRQNEEQGLSDRDGLTAFRAIELHGLKFIVSSPPLRRRLTAGRNEVKGSLFHVQNLWISMVEYGNRGIMS